MKLFAVVVVAVVVCFCFEPVWTRGSTCTISFAACSHSLRRRCLASPRADDVCPCGRCDCARAPARRRDWKQIDVHQESKQRESPPRRSSSSPATPRTSQKGVRSTSKGGRSKSPTSAEFRAAIKEKSKMEVEIGEHQKTLDEMSAAMANLHQEDYGSTIRIQELERRCEIASKQSGHLVSHRQHHMAEAWRQFEEEAHFSTGKRKTWSRIL